MWRTEGLKALLCSALQVNDADSMLDTAIEASHMEQANGPGVVRFEGPLLPAPSETLPGLPRGLVMQLVADGNLYNLVQCVTLDLASVCVPGCQPAHIESHSLQALGPVLAAKFNE